MRKMFLIVAPLLLAAAVFTYGQRPPESGSEGVPFLKVNINPTDVPPEVNINPNRSVPRVEVARMPDVRFTPSGCADGRNFRTAVARSITGPLMVTYRNTSQQTSVTLADAQGNQRVDISPGTHIQTAIYLATGQSLQFDSNVMYSGCVPD